MVDYPYAGILVADAVTFRRATSAAVTVYDANDTASATPLALKDLSGLPLPNPLTSTADGFVPPFITTSEGVKLVGGGLAVVEYSHKGIRDAASAAAAAAQISAQAATATAALVGAPADTAIAAAVNGNGATKTALSATYASKALAVNPDDVGSDVVAIIGQSNARGDGEGADLTYLDFANPRVLQFVGDATSPMYRTAVLAVDPLFHHTPAPLSHGVGAGVVFGREYVKTIPANRNLLLVPSARGATGFTTTDYSWDPAATPTMENLYVKALAQIHAALNLNPKNRLVAVIWCQGEADNSLTQAQYATLLDSVISGIRTEFSNADLPFLIGSMVPDKVAEGDAGYIRVNQAHIDTPRRKTRTWFVQGPSGAYNSVTNGGTIHYNGAGQRELGQRYAKFLPYAQANVTGAAPVPPEAVTVTQSGTTLTAAWTPGKGRMTDFLIQYSVGGGTWQTLARTASIDTIATITGMALGSTVTTRVAAINEQGTSAATSSTALVLDTMPGQVAGLTLGSVTSNRQDLSWTALAGARLYKVEYKRAVDSVWTTFTTTAATSVSVTGLSSSISYNYRVTAVNNAGTSTTPSATATGSTTSLQALATAVGTDPLFAYSLRKMRTAYAGSAIRVRRSSDNVEADIGFTAGGVMDEAALLAHVGAGDGYVVTFYDQGTAGTNFTQATTTLQPKIVTAGVVEKTGSLPAVRFTGAQYLSHSAPALFAAAASTTLMVHTAPAAAVSQAVFGEDNNGASGYYFPAYYNGAGQPTFYDGTTARVGSGLTVNGALMQQTSQDTGTALTIDINGVNKLNYTPYTPPAATIVRGRMGAYVPGAASAFYTGYVCEVAAWTSALASTPKTDGQSNQKTYYGTP